MTNQTTFANTPREDASFEAIVSDDGVSMAGSLNEEHHSSKKAKKHDVVDLPEEIEEELVEEVIIPQRVLGHYGYRFVKRVFDIVFSAGVITVLFIPSLILCVAIRIETPGGPLYVQRRVGKITKDGRLQTFPMFKFRSMVKDADKMLDRLQNQNEAQGPIFKMHDDPRVTNIGSFIRKHSIDEMPQFINVLAGHLAIVGPRPPLPTEVDHYTSHDMKRLTVKPGLTGYWQIRNRSEYTFEDMVEQDLKYIQERSCLVDLKIIGRTIALVFKANGGAC